MTEVVAALIWQGDKFMICQHPTHKARGLLWELKPKPAPATAPPTQNGRIDGDFENQAQKRRDQSF